MTGNEGPTAEAGAGCRSARQPAVALPKAHLLSYVAAVSTPTKVRKMAFWGVLVAAGIQFAAAAGFGFFYVRLVRIELGRARGLVVFPGPIFVPPPPATAHNVLRAAVEAARDVPLVPIAMLLFGGTALFQAALAAGVKRGNRLASLSECFALVPLALAMTLFAAGVGGAGMVNILGTLSPRDIPVGVFCLFASLLGAVLLGLMKDLAVFLLWIARNPLTEKTPVPFLSLQ